MFCTAPQADSRASDRSDTNHTVLPANDTISAFNSVSIPMRRLIAYTHSSERLSSTYYSFIDPKRINGGVGHVGWHTADGLPPMFLISTRQPHVMAHARESSLIKYQRSTQCATSTITTNRLKFIPKSISTVQLSASYIWWQNLKENRRAGWSK